MTCKLHATAEFSTNGISLIIRNLNLNKAHDHDMISIQMWKICDESICSLQEIICPFKKRANYWLNGKNHCVSSLQKM